MGMLLADNYFVGPEKSCHGPCYQTEYTFGINKKLGPQKGPCGNVEDSRMACQKQGRMLIRALSNIYIVHLIYYPASIYCPRCRQNDSPFDILILLGNLSSRQGRLQRWAQKQS